MAILILDTACPEALVGLIDDNQQRQHVLKNTFQHAEQLPFAVDEVLKQSGLDLSSVKEIWVGRGPGSFMGIRIAIAYAQGLSLVLKIPLKGFNTLKAMAFDPSLPAGKGLCVMDAKRQELYVQAFEKNTCVTFLGDACILSVKETEHLAWNFDFVAGFGASFVAHPIKHISIKACQEFSNIYSLDLEVMPIYLRKAIE